jgi:hypothetical protein
VLIARQSHGTKSGHDGATHGTTAGSRRPARPARFLVRGSRLCTVPHCALPALVQQQPDSQA